MRLINVKVAVCLLTLSVFQITMAAEDNSALLERAQAAMMRHDLSTARQLLSPLADKGDAAAQNLFGDLCSMSGDEAKAVTWYRMAAEKGNAKAQNNLGMAYVKGQGVAHDDKEGFNWLRKAAEQGHVKAENNLSVLYSSGRGVAKDESESAKWCRKAAEQGDLSAQNNLALKYKNGRGVGKDASEALKWFLKSAQQGFVPAQYQVGEMYESELGAGNDKAEALKWYKSAAAHGFPPAQDKLLSLLDADKQIEKGVISLTPGQESAVEFDVVDGMLQHPRRILSKQNMTSASAPKSDSFDLSLSFDEKANMTVLKIKNNCKKDVVYECSIKARGENYFQPTSVLPIKAGLVNFESWPFAVGELMVRNLRFTGKP